MPNSPHPHFQQVARQLPGLGVWHLTRYAPFVHTCDNARFYLWQWLVRRGSRGILNLGKLLEYFRPSSVIPNVVRELFNENYRRFAERT